MQRPRGLLLTKLVNRLLARAGQQAAGKRTQEAICAQANRGRPVKKS
jgi:hypothetical protein